MSLRHCRFSIRNVWSSKLSPNKIDVRTDRGVAFRRHDASNPIVVLNRRSVCSQRITRRTEKKIIFVDYDPVNFSQLQDVGSLRESWVFSRSIATTTLVVYSFQELTQRDGSLYHIWQSLSDLITWDVALQRTKWFSLDTPDRRCKFLFFPFFIQRIRRLRRWCSTEYVRQSVRRSTMMFFHMNTYPGNGGLQSLFFFQTSNISY